jgi:Domain of unknown function (DUF6471)
LPRTQADLISCRSNLTRNRKCARRPRDPDCKEPRYRNGPSRSFGKPREAKAICADLAKRLEKHGFKETEASVTKKLKRGTFPATWFLAVLAALELDGVALEEI